jgi:hypothetical protein
VTSRNSIAELFLPPERITSLHFLDQTGWATLTFQMWDDSSPLPNLPLAYLVSPPTSEDLQGDTAFMGLNVLDPANVNLSPAQKELIMWHFKLGHFHLEYGFSICFTFEREMLSRYYLHVTMRVSGLSVLHAILPRCICVQQKLL